MAIKYRQELGRPLTYAEGDENFRTLEKSVGKTLEDFPTLAAALVEDPERPGQQLVPDGVVFTVNDGIDAGYWRRDSSDTKGAVFLRDIVTRDDINSIQSEVDVLGVATARYAFDTLQEAQDKWASFSQEEKDALDGREFIIATGADAGVYKWDSTETGGTYFVSPPPISLENINRSNPVNNIIERTNYVDGYMSLSTPGELSPNPDYKSTGFVDVSFLEVNQPVFVKNLQFGYARAVHYFDSDKNPIDFGTPETLSVNNATKTAELNSRPTQSVKYIRFTVKTARTEDTTDVNTVMILQENTDSLEYLPYIRPVTGIENNPLLIDEVPYPSTENSPTPKKYVDSKIEGVEIKNPTVYEDAEELKDHTTTYSGPSYPGWIRPFSGVVNRAILKLGVTSSTKDTITFRIGYQDSLGPVYDETASFTELATKEVSKSNLPASVDYFTLDFDSITIPDNKYIVILTDSPLKTALFNDPVVGVDNYKFLYKDVANGSTYYNYEYWYSAAVTLQYVNNDLLKIIDDRVDNSKDTNLFDLKGRRMAALGDSITAPSDSWAGRAANMLGLELLNLAVSGCHFNDYYDGDTLLTEIDLSGTGANGDYSNNTMSNQVRRLIQYATPAGEQIDWTHPITGEYFSIPVEKGVGLGNTDFQPDIIVLAASTNDTPNIEAGEEWETVRNQSLSDLTRKNLYSSVRWAVETLMINFPKAQIFLATPIQGNARPFYNAGVERRERLITVGNYFNCQIIDSLHESGVSEKFEWNSANGDGRYLYDGLHPNSAGQELMGNYFALQLRNKYFPKPDVIF